MSIEIKWSVYQIDCYAEHFGNQNVVFSVHWVCEKIDGNFNGRRYGSVNIEYQDGSSFTPYNMLTFDQVMGWVKDSIGVQLVNKIEEDVIKQIDDQKNPPVVNLPLPWSGL